MQMLREPFSFGYVPYFSMVWIKSAFKFLFNAQQGIQFPTEWI